MSLLCETFSESFKLNVISPSSDCTKYFTFHIVTLICLICSFATLFCKLLKGTEFLFQLCILHAPINFILSLWDVLNEYLQKWTKDFLTALKKNQKSIKVFRFSTAEIIKNRSALEFQEIYQNAFREGFEGLRNLCSIPRSLLGK